MHQHQHARLPVEQLQDVRQPVVALLEALLEKDPARRFQNPTELLRTIARVTDAIDRGGKISRVEPAECAFDGFECLYPQAANKTRSEKDLYSQIARYRKRCFWSRGGYRFSG